MTTQEHWGAPMKGEPKAAQQVHVKARNTSQIVPFAHEKISWAGETSGTGDFHVRYARGC